MPADDKIPTSSSSPEGKDVVSTIGFSRLSSAQAAADAVPILVNDETYHLFHLTTPPFTRHHPARLRSSWWRMRSRDLVNWTRDAQPCLTPSSNEPGPDAQGAPDADGIWTGAAVSGPDGAMNIFYTGYSLQHGGRQVILRTRARDKVQDDGSSVPDPHAAAGFDCPGTQIQFHGAGRDQLEDVDFRDPFVFYHAGERRYWMVVASRLARGPYWTRGCIALLTSTDLDTWTFAPEPLHSPNDLLCPECPELFHLPGVNKWYLVYSRLHAPNAGTVYRIADSPYGPFRVPRDGSHGRLDGRRWYAAKSCAKAGDPNTRVFFGWIGDYVDDEGKWLWGGDLAVPREVSAVTEEGPNRGNLRLVPAPAAVALAEETSTAVTTATATATEPLQVVLSSATSGTTTVLPLDLSSTAAAAAADMDGLVTVAFGVASCDAHTFGVVLQPDADQRGFRLQFSPAMTVVGTRTLYAVALLADFPPLDDFWADQYNIHLPRLVDGPEIVRHEGVELDADGVRIFLRRQLVEMFCGGRSISFRFPRPPAPAESSSKGGPQPMLEEGGRRLSWFVEDGQVTLTNVEVRRGGQLDKTM